MSARLFAQGRVGHVLVMAAFAVTAHGTIRAAQPQTALLPSHGEYMGRKWDIGADHLLCWDAKPYVRVGFTGNGDLAQMLKAGFTQFTLTPDEEWPINGLDPRIVRRVDETRISWRKAEPPTTAH